MARKLEKYLTLIILNNFGSIRIIEQIPLTGQWWINWYNT